jgi:hypothetical protein
MSDDVVTLAAELIRALEGGPDAGRLLPADDDGPLLRPEGCLPPAAGEG